MDNVYQKYLQRYIYLSNIDKLRKMKFDLEDKIKCYSSITSVRVKLINMNKSDLQINSNTFEVFNQNVNEKKTAIEKHKYSYIHIK